MQDKFTKYRNTVPKVIDQTTLWKLLCRDFILLMEITMLSAREKDALYLSSSQKVVLFCNANAYLQFTTSVNPTGEQNRSTRNGNSGVPRLF